MPITNVILNLRTYPIRINNVSAADHKTICYTGNYWDAKEITWNDVAIRAGWTPEEFTDRYDYALKTSVTNKIRRVFEFPVERMKYVDALNGGLLDDTLLYSLNFINFIDKEVEGTSSVEKVCTDKVVAWLQNTLFKAIDKSRLKWIRTGPKHSQIVDLMKINHSW